MRLLEEEVTICWILLEKMEFCRWCCPWVITAKELTGSSPPEKNWRGIVIAILVIIMVLSMIVVAIIVITPKSGDINTGEPFTFEDVTSGNYRPQSFGVKWIGEKDMYVYQSKHNELMEYDCARNTTTLVMGNVTFRQLSTNSYLVSEDLEYVLLKHDVEMVYRYSSYAKYSIYHRYAKDPESKLIPFPQGVGKGWKEKKLQYVSWSPKGHSLVFIYDNNLYYQKDPFTTATKISASGVPGRVYNGIADWLYEEEIFSSTAAHWWSADGAYLCYAHFDDSNVPTYKFPIYGPGSQIYDNIKQVHFPKAGDSGKILPKVRLLVVDLINPGRVHKHLNPPVELRGKEHYLTMVTWQDSTHVIVTWSNRPQNKSLICVCDVTNGACHTDLEESGSEGVGWVEIPTPRVIGGGQSYLMILPERDGNHGYWKHIALISTQYRSEAAKTFVTQGTWDVIKLVGYDEQKKLVYYISTDGDPRKRHLFRVALPKSDQLSPPECLTCDLGEDCQYVSASFSHSGKYYLLSCLGPGVPQYILRGTQNNLNILLEDNAALKERLEKKAVSKPEYYQINTDDGEKIWVKVYLPPTLNKKHIVIYPLLVNTYGAPDTQLVTFQFRLGWELYLTSMEKIIVVKVDGRGSGARGQRFLHRIYRNLGTFEVQDQITAVRYLQEKLSYVDHERCAIWGWSFGGFVTSHVMGDKSNVITCGIAVAPVTDWRYYDTAYTEKYMGLAVDNYRGYDNANASRKAANIRGKNLMVIHGTADDNVHFQHTAQFIKALTEADVDFRIHVYADKKHSISGGNTRKHLYRTITKYLQQQCWDGGEPRESEADTEES